MCPCGPMVCARGVGVWVVVIVAKSERRGEQGRKWEGVLGWHQYGTEEGE